MRHVISARDPSLRSSEIRKGYFLYFDMDRGVQRRMISVDNFFRIFEIIIFCSAVAICHLVHDVETMFHLSFVLTASENLF